MQYNIKKLSLRDLTPDCLDSFDRLQYVTKCWRKIDDNWEIKDIQFVENWDTSTKRLAVVREMRNTVKSNGAVFAYMEKGQILALGTVGSEFFGITAKYVDLELLLVSRELRGKGLGKILFNRCAEFAKSIRAEKMYVSGHSCIETQAFYKAVGCVLTKEINAELFRREPCDVHLEYVL